MNIEGYRPCQAHRSGREEMDIPVAIALPIYTTLEDFNRLPEVQLPQMSESDNNANNAHPHFTRYPMAIPISRSFSGIFNGILTRESIAIYQHRLICRKIALFQMIYFATTFIIIQPIGLGLLGLTSGFIGFYGSGTPVDSKRPKWINAFRVMNIVLFLYNLIIFVMVSVSMANTYDDTASGSRSNSSTIGNNSQQEIHHAFDMMNMHSRSQSLLLITGAAVNFLVLSIGALKGRNYHYELLRNPPPDSEVTVVIPNA